MKVTVFLLLILLSGFIPEANADKIYLKNGHSIEGIITRETDEYVALSVGAGTVKFYLWQIDHTEHSTEEENKELSELWEGERLRKEAELQRLQEQMKLAPKKMGVERMGDHFLLNALLNEKIETRLMLDTGASFVVLSPDIARKLGIDIRSVIPDAKLTLADGTEVPAKVFKLNTMSVQNVQAKDVEAVVLLKEQFFKDFDGLLGMSFLKLFKFEINLEENKLILEKS